MHKLNAWKTEKYQENPENANLDHTKEFTVQMINVTPQK